MTDQPTPQPSLSELFAIDPLTLTKDSPQIEQMVAAFRAQRAQFQTAEAAGARAPRQPKAGGAKPAKKLDAEALKNLDLDLGDL